MGSSEPNSRCDSRFDSTIEFGAVERRARITRDQREAEQIKEAGVGEPSLCLRSSCPP